MVKRNYPKQKWMNRPCKHPLVKRERFLSKDKYNVFYVVVWFCPKCEKFLETKEYGKTPNMVLKIDGETVKVNGK